MRDPLTLVGVLVAGASLILWLIEGPLHPTALVYMGLIGLLLTLWGMKRDAHRRHILEIRQAIRRGEAAGGRLREGE